MNRHARDKVLMVLAVILCAAGIIMSLQTLNQTREKTKQIRDKIDRLEAVRQFGAAEPASESAKAAFDSLDQHTPQSTDLGEIRVRVADQLRRHGASQKEVRRATDNLLDHRTPILQTSSSLTHHIHHA